MQTIKDSDLRRNDNNSKLSFIRTLTVGFGISPNLLTFILTHFISKMLRSFAAQAPVLSHDIAVAMLGYYKALADYNRR